MAHIGKKLADEVSLSYTKKGRYVKGINTKSLPMHGVT